ncbi:MAG: hypothetical protein LBR83_07445 [Clostridiales bacterium]|jgi:methyl-accepting chemotaxis protein|nr:hypothetical protein [Clostridiales bacterium]
MQIYILWALLVIFAVLTVILAVKTRMENARAKKITEAVIAAAKGNFNVFPQSGKGELEPALNSLTNTVKRLTGEIASVSEQHAAGQINAAVDERAYEGAYRETAAKFNKALKVYNNETDELLNGLNGLRQGDFNARPGAFPGGRARVNECVEALREQLKGLNDAVKEMSAAINDCKFSQKAETANLSGEYARTLKGLTGAVNALSKPVAETVNALNRIGNGDFSGMITGEFRGEFAGVKTALSETNKRLSEHAREVISSLSRLSSRRPEPPGEYAYPGDLAKIKTELERVYSLLSEAKPETRPSLLNTAKTPERAKPTAAATARPVLNPPKAAVSGTKTSTADGTAFTTAHPKLQNRTVIAPNASHIYDSPDFGKY